MWRLHPSTLRGALWAARAARSTRRQLRRDGLQASVDRPRVTGVLAGRGVGGILQSLSPTCLERALILQAWRAAQGERHDVVIGVPPEGLGSESAHAWLDDGREADAPGRYLELHRLSAPHWTV